MKARVVLPGEAELDEAAVGRAVAGEAGREYVVLGELLRVWVVLEGCERGELPVLEVFARFEEADKKMGDAELSERKPRHVPCARQEGPHRDGSVVCQSGWRGEMFGERAVLYQDVPVLLRHGLAGDTLRLVVSVKTPAFAAGPRLDDMERLLSSSSYAERQSRQCEAWLAVKVACLPHLEVVGPQLAHSHTAVLCVSVRNCDSSVPMVFHHLSLSEGSTRYNGPAGMQSVAFGELFALHVEEERDAEVGPQDAVQVLARLQPRPLAFVQYTDWEGSFSGRLVATWSAPGVRGRVMSWLDVAWKVRREGRMPNVRFCNCVFCRDREATICWCSVSVLLPPGWGSSLE